MDRRANAHVDGGKGGVGVEEPEPRRLERSQESGESSEHGQNHTTVYLRPLETSGPNDAHGSTTWSRLGILSTHAAQPEATAAVEREPSHTGQAQHAQRTAGGGFGTLQRWRQGRHRESGPCAAPAGARGPVSPVGPRTQRAACRRRGGVFPCRRRDRTRRSPPAGPRLPGRRRRRPAAGQCHQPQGGR